MAIQETKAQHSCPHFFTNKIWKEMNTKFEINVIKITNVRKSWFEKFQLSVPWDQKLPKCKGTKVQEKDLAQSNYFITISCVINRKMILVHSWQFLAIFGHF
jgi:hypothetical protein